MQKINGKKKLVWRAMKTPPRGVPPMPKGFPAFFKYSVVDGLS